MTTPNDSSPGPWPDRPGLPDVREWLAGPGSRLSELARLGSELAVEIPVPEFDEDLEGEEY